eukprot:11978602-Karenia_brevis.AAC.1
MKKEPIKEESVGADGEDMDVHSVCSSAAVSLQSTTPLKDLSLEELKAEQLSLQRQYAAVADLVDPRSVRLQQFLASELKTVRHEITLRKPVAEQIT